MYEIFHTLIQEKSMKLCKMKECENKHKAKGWCRKHYERWLKYGDPNIVLVKMHGYSSHPLYTVWQNMRERCYNPNYKQYKDYGGRGITVCDEWISDSKAFIEWALPLWKKGLQIDRKDNEGNYGPSNCRFVTYVENQHNTRLLRKTNISGYRGVFYSKEHKKWRAQITINSKHKHLGLFNSAIEAALAYNTAVPDNRPKNIIT